MKAQNKKHLIKSYDKLPQEARDAFDEKYGEGYAEAAQKITKPDGSILYVVPLETDDAVYMVKVDLVIDTNFSEEEFEKEAFGLSKADEDIVGGESEEGENGKEKFVLIHGDYSDIGDIAATRDHNEEE